MKPSQNHPWRKSFIIKEWQKNNKITRRKKLHYEASDEDKGRYINYVKTK